MIIYTHKLEVIADVPEVLEEYLKTILTKTENKEVIRITCDKQYSGKYISNNITIESISNKIIDILYNIPATLVLKYSISMSSDKPIPIRKFITTLFYDNIYT